jgi:hypothetical protein
VSEFLDRILIKLEKYGINSNMRYHEKVIMLENDRDFWRGFIDGNARFDISKYGRISLRIKKGHELILQFKTFAEKILGRTIDEPILEVKNWSITLSDGNAVELLQKIDVR